MTARLTSATHFLASVAIMAGLVFGAGYIAFSCSRVHAADYVVESYEKPVLLAQADTGSGSGSAVATTSPTTDAPAAAPALPDPAESPQESASLLFKLYKAGHLIPMIVVASFFLLTLLQRWVAWLRTGYRRLLVASLLGSLGMLAERAADGTTPNLLMILGALGVGFAMWTKTEGAPKTS